MIERPGVVIATSDLMISREIVENDSSENGVWSVSSPIPGAQIVGLYEVSHGQYIVLTITDGGKYQIFHTVNKKTHTLVHTHDTEITCIQRIGYGKMIFSALDGWWMTIDSGTTWEQIGLTAPIARKIAAIPKASTIVVLAYGADKKIYRCEHSFNEFLEPLSWTEVFDASDAIPWYPAIAGGGVAVLVGFGNKLIRTIDGSSWQLLATVDGCIKSIVTSDQSMGPKFLIEVEKDGLSKLYWSIDAGDSIYPDTTRVQPSLAATGVVETGSDKRRSIFVVVGRRTNGQVVHVVTDEEY